jgi:DNA-binding NtrC family response regulator
MPPVRPADAAASVLRVLVIDDDPIIREVCVGIASSLGFVTETAHSLTSAQHVLAQGPTDIILLDLKLPGGSGLILLDDIRRRQPAAEVIIVTAFATVDSAVEAIRVGVADYLTKPFTVDEISATLQRAAQRHSFHAEARRLRDRLRTGGGMGQLLGRSAAMEKLYRIISKVAFTTHPVLILGESGTGKETVARSIHSNGPNAEKPFATVDCGALEPTLIESELFGHVKGAFTGADRARVGLLSSVGQGTVFLDEIGELPLELQAKLLRVLQEKKVRPLGSTQALSISARILAATNRDLVRMVDSGRFRKDLFYRLNVVKLNVPSLRDRKVDIPMLSARILERMSREKNEPLSLADDAMRLMMAYDWPGNVRELEHAIERAGALSSGPVLHLGDFPTQLQEIHLNGQPNSVLHPSLLGTESEEVLPIAELEKQAILTTLRHLNGDKLLAARLLGIGKTTLYRKLKEYGVSEDDL